MTYGDALGLVFVAEVEAVDGYVFGAVVAAERGRVALLVLHLDGFVEHGEDEALDAFLVCVCE